MIGSSGDISSASTLRRVSRKDRPAMVIALVAVRGRRVVLGGVAVSSDIGGLLGGVAVAVAGQGQEDVVQGGCVDGKPFDQPAGRIELVEQGPDLGGGAVGGHREEQPSRV